MTKSLPIDPQLEPHYHTLGLTSSATPDQLRDAYRQLIQQLHPDKLPESTPTYLKAMAEEEFIRVQEAYYALRSRTTSLARRSQACPRRDRPGWLGLLASALAGSALTFGIMTGLNLSRSSQVQMVNQDLSPQTEAERTQTLAADPQAQTPTTSDPDPTVISKGVTPDESSPVASFQGSEPLSPPRDPIGAPENPRDPFAAPPSMTSSQAVDPLAKPDRAQESLTASATSEVFAPTPDQIERFVITLKQVQPILQVTHSRLDQARSPEERQQIKQGFESTASQLIIANGLTPAEYQQISWAARQDPTIANQVKQVAQTTPEPGTP